MHWAWTWFTIVTSLALPVHLIAWMSARARVRMLREIWRPGIARMQGRDRDVPRTTEPGYVTLHPLDVPQCMGPRLATAMWTSPGGIPKGASASAWRPCLSALGRYCARGFCSP